MKNILFTKIFKSKFNAILLNLLIFSFTPLFSQQGVVEVVRAGNKVITAEEFLHRYELTPKFVSHIQGMEGALKREFLYTLAAEKLMALAAEELLLDTLKPVRIRLSQLEKTFVRDALFYEVATSLIDRSDSSILNELNKSVSKLFLKSLRSSDQNQIKSLYNFLETGLPFDSIFYDFYGENAPDNSIWIEYGTFDYDIEEIVYKLKPGKFTEPVKWGENWFIFYLADKKDTTFKNATEANNEVTRVRKLYIERMTTKYGNDFKREFFRDKKITANGRLLRNLSSRLFEAVYNFYLTVPAEQKSSKTPVKTSILLSMFNTLPEDTLNSVYISLESGNTTLTEFIYFLLNENLELDELNLDNMTKKLNELTRTFIEYELLAAEGYKRGLKSSPAVIKDMNTWRDFVLAEAIISMFADSSRVTDDEIRDHYLKRYQGRLISEQLKLLVYSTESLDSAGLFLEHLAEIDDFKEVYINFALNGDKNRFIEPEFKPALEYGEAGKLAINLKPGDTQGPTLFENYFLILHLIDKKISGIDNLEEFEIYKEKIRKDISWNKYIKSIEDNTVKLAVENKLALNFEKVDELKVTNTNIVTYRYIGFGGRITAYPINRPFGEWFEKFLKYKENNP